MKTSYDLKIQFDPAYKDDYHIRTVDEVLHITYKEHPHIVSVSPTDNIRQNSLLYWFSFYLLSLSFDEPLILTLVIIILQIIVCGLLVVFGFIFVCFFVVVCFLFFLGGLGWVFLEGCVFLCYFQFLGVGFLGVTLNIFANLRLYL